MEFYEVLKSRRSVRAYLDREIPEEVINRLGEAVQAAPTACNRQPFIFRVVMDNAIREKICEVYSPAWLAQAPAIVVAIGNPKEAWQRLEGDSIVSVDVAIAMEHLVLAAAAEKLGTCWICAYDRKKMARAIGITAPLEVIAISPLGYPAEEPELPPRKPIADIFRTV